MSSHDSRCEHLPGRSVIRRCFAVPRACRFYPIAVSYHNVWLMAGMACVALLAPRPSFADPTIHFNPQPLQRGTLRVTIENAPGPFDVLTGYVLYQVTNMRCLPLQPGSGATLALQKKVVLALQPIGDSYEASFQRDALADESYFGLGTCHWSVGGVGVNLTAHHMVFSPGLSALDVESGAPVKVYFAKSAYQNPARQGSTTGTATSTYVTSHPGAFFSVSLQASAKR